MVFSFPQLLVSGFLFFYVSILFAFSPPDYYGADKIIPKNIKFEYPVKREITEKELQNNNFKIASISQPGTYRYYTTYQPKELGDFYIRAYEVTSGDRLSEKRMTEYSKVKVENFNTKVHSGGFTIYEGSWGDKYGARIELWFKPKNNEEYKIIEKNYIVEGWMR
jgi:hypothetical protein